MEEKVYLDKLAKRDIKPTAIRLLILKSMMEAGRAVSQLDLETLLDTVDKSTISRTITLFLSHHLIHSIDDGSGSWKYAVCDDSCNCVLKDLHSHFYCEKCHRTFCLEKIHIPVIYNPQIQISAESETKRSIFREKDKTKRSKKESAQHSKSRNKSFVMTSVSAL